MVGIVSHQIAPVYCRHDPTTEDVGNDARVEIPKPATKALKGATCPKFGIRSSQISRAFLLNVRPVVSEFLLFFPSLHLFLCLKTMVLMTL